MTKKKQEVDFRTRKLVFMDFEMTGLDPVVHEITEVGVLVVNPKTLNVEKEYYAKVRPEHIETAVKKALKIGGYSDAKWTDSRKASLVFRELNRLAPGGIPSGWNVHKDYAFLYNTLKRYRIKDRFDHHLLDVAVLGYQKYFNHTKPVEMGLRDVARILKVNIPEKHDAMSDIYATYKIYLKLLEQ